MNETVEDMIQRKNLNAPAVAKIWSLLGYELKTQLAGAQP